MKAFTKKIVLENGREFYGYGFGADREAINEIVFNTSMVGYQEIMSDPSYTDQMVVMTYPLIGNYGMADEDYETKTPTIGGMIVREYNDSPSNFRYTKTLNEVFEEHDIPAIWGVDTRALTRIIRDEGTQKVLITDVATPRDEALRKLGEYVMPRDMVSRVSCKKRWMSRVPNHKYDVVAVDCGIKYNIIRLLNRVGCNVTVMPYNSTVEEIMAFAEKIGAKKIGIATCVGLLKESRTLAAILRKHGFEVYGVACKAGTVPKTEVGIPEECCSLGKNMCNPILQAKILNAKGTQLNVVMGLCVGHDSLFYKYSEALTTTGVTKDRVLGHNPVAALYTAESYYNKLMSEE